MINKRVVINTRQSGPKKHHSKFYKTSIGEQVINKRVVINSRPAGPKNPTKKFARLLIGAQSSREVNSDL